MSRVQRIINGSDNLASVVLYSDGAPVDMVSAGVTRVQIEVSDDDGTVIDSDVISMSWSTMIVVDGVNAWPIQFVGDDAGLAAGHYRDCKVRVYDNENPAGIIWPDPLTLVVE